VCTKKSYISWLLAAIPFFFVSALEIRDGEPERSAAGATGGEGTAAEDSPGGAVCASMRCVGSHGFQHVNSRETNGIEW